MKTRIGSENGLASTRLLLALVLFLTAAFLTLFSVGSSDFYLSNANTLVSAAGSDAGYGLPIASKGGHSIVDQLIVEASRAIGTFGDKTSTASHTYAMKAPTGSKTGSGTGAATLAPMISVAVPATVSPSLRDLPAFNAFSGWVEQPEPESPSNRFPSLPRRADEVDPVVQRSAAANMPATSGSFEGINIDQACGTCLPPDTNGAVGPNHYVQMVNSSVAVYDKAGNVVVSPKAINELWSGDQTSECYTHNNGDPIVIYDQLADRWMLSQFVVQADTENYAQCIAVSQTSDPAGNYYLYEFDESADTFHDYPHIGVWPDGYYMSTNQFPNSLTGTVAAGAWVFERDKMLVGQPARYVFFDETPLANCTPGSVECVYTPFGQLPSTLDGRTLPPTGAPNYFVEVDDVNTPNADPTTGLHDEMRIWKFHVDWNNPANSSFGIGSSAPIAKAGLAGQFAGNAGNPDFVLPIADYLASACQIENGPDDCTPQKLSPPQPPQYLDVLGDRLMYRLAYRNFGDHESLVVNHTVDVVDPSNAVGRNGVRWYEIRGLSGTPSVYQQSTFAPLDATNPLWRWMGSAAMDHSGDLAIGYSAS